jgi:2-isopropylmalate synthase
LAYQPFDPKEVGRDIAMVFGPLSGGNHAKSIVEANGYRCNDEEKADIAQFIKNHYSERRKGITDDELMQAYFDYRKPIDVVSVDYSKSANRSEVILKGRFFEEEGEIRNENEGRDSALVALKQAIDARYPGVTLMSHTSRSRGESVHAVSVSTIVVSVNGESFTGIGEDSDIEVSAMKALINAVNRAYIDSNFSLGAEV